MQIKIIICGKIEEGQDERVPVHDGVSLSFAVVSLGCHRNTPDCTLPRSQWLSDGVVAIFRAGGAAVLAWGVGGVSLLLRHISPLDAGIEVGGHQLAGGSGTESQSGNILRHAEVLLLVGAALQTQADGEDGEVGELDVLAEQEQLLGARHSVGQDALDGSLAERGVVTCHVLRQFVETDGLICYYARIPFLVCLALWIVVLIQFYSYHTLGFLRQCKDTTSEKGAYDFL